MASNRMRGLTGAAGTVTVGHSTLQCLMRRQQPPPMSATAVPTVDDMFRVWGAGRGIRRARR